MTGRPPRPDYGGPLRKFLRAGPGAFPVALPPGVREWVSPARSGDVVLVLSRAKHECTTPLPDVCIRCGFATTERMKTQFAWAPLWIRLPAALTPAVLFSTVAPALRESLGVFGLIAVHSAVICVFQSFIREGTALLPVCGRCVTGHGRRRWAVAAVWLIPVAVGFSWAAVPFQLAGSLFPLWLTLWLGSILLAVAATILHHRRPVRSVRITEDALWLRGVAPAFLAALGGSPGCLGCGYDLTGNASGRCPECGTVTPAAAPPEGPRRG